MMRFQERSFSGKIFRPRPEIYAEADGSLLVIATPWGPRDAAKKTIKVIKDYFLSSRADWEATSPFNKLACLSSVANELRIAVKLANDTVFNEDNKNEYVSGVELAVIAKNGSEISWIQIGMPYMFLDRPEKYVMPLSAQSDLSSEYTANVGTLPPLPAKLLGIDMESDFSVESIHVQAHDRILLASRSGWPQSILSLPPNERNLEDISKICASDDPDTPFWLGIFNL